MLENIGIPGLIITVLVFGAIIFLLRKLFKTN